MATRKLFPKRIFQEKDLYNLLVLVMPAAPKWRWVGLALGFLDSVLDRIEATVKGPKECFRKMLSQWLKRAPPNHDPPSSHALAKALRCEMVEEERLANDLEEYFSETGTMDTETVESPPTATAATTSQPHSDTQDTVMVESPPTPKSADVNLCVLSSDTQDTVMVDCPTPKQLSYRDIREYCLQLYTEYYLQLYPVWHKDPCAPLVQRYLKLTESVKKALEKRGITARAISDVLREQSLDEGTAYMERALKEAASIQRAADIQEVFSVVTSRSSFLDPKPLEHLIKKFDLKEVEEELERYKGDLHQAMLLMMEASPDTEPPPRKKSRVGPDPEVRREQCTTV